MFLTRLRTLRDDPERGSALMAVIAVMAVTVLVAATVSAVSINAAGFSTATRAGVQARAAADAGIDVAFARIVGGDFDCQVGPRAGDPQFAVRIQYFVGGVEKPCSGSFSGAPEDAVITSTGTADQKGTAGDSQDHHTVIAEVDITVTPGSAASVTFDKAVFTDGQLTVATNNVKLTESSTGANDADVYTNGAYVCRTQIDQQGTIHAQSHLDFENSCTITGDAWSAGDIEFTSQAKVLGNVYAAGADGVDLGPGHVAGNVLTNGAVTINTNNGKSTCAGTSEQYVVCGTVLALGGGISVSNGAGIRGSALAKGNVELSQANSNTMVGGSVHSTHGRLRIDNAGSGNVRGNVRVAGVIDSRSIDRAILGTRCSSGSCRPAPTLAWPAGASPLAPEVGYPATGTVNAPPRESMPKVASDATALTAWTVDGWAVREFTGPTSCQQAKDHIAGQPSVKTVVVVRGCSQPMSWEGATITLKADLAILSHSGFTSKNGITITSDSTTVRNLMWIVPSDAPAVTWTPLTEHPGQYKPSCTGTTGDINMGTSNFTLTKINWLVYSPCLVDFGNSATGFAGQVYSGQMGDFPMNTTMQYAPMNVPGATVPGGGAPTVPGSSTAVITARYDAAR